MQQREMLIQSGQQALEAGKFSMAVAKLRQALESDPDDTEIRLLMAEALAEDGKIRPALRLLEETPAHIVDADIELVRGDLLLHEGQVDQARLAYQKSLEIDPQSEDGWVSLGLVDSATERFEEALSAYDRALQINAQSVFALTARGDTQCRMGQMDRAISSYQQALSIDPDDAQVHHSLGDLYVEQDQLKEAEASYQQAQQLDPEFEQVYLSLGNLYLGQDKSKAALEAFERFLTLETDPAAKEVREEVKAVIEGLKG